MNPYRWLKLLFRIVDVYDDRSQEIASQIRDLRVDTETYRDRVRQLEAAVIHAEQVIKDRTDVHADIDHKGDSTIIVAGSYRNRDYVRVFNVNSDNFNDVIRHLIEQEKLAARGRYDVAPTLDVSYIIDREKRR